MKTIYLADNKNNQELKTTRWKKHLKTYKWRHRNFRNLNTTKRWCHGIYTLPHNSLSHSLCLRSNATNTYKSKKLNKIKQLRNIFMQHIFIYFLLNSKTRLQEYASLQNRQDHRHIMEQQREREWER